MEEAAFLKYQNQVPMPDKEEFLQAYSRAQELYASHGITTVQEGLLSQRLLPLYGLLAGSGLLNWIWWRMGISGTARLSLNN